MGHADCIVIGDCGLPIPHEVIFRLVEGVPIEDIL